VEPGAGDGALALVQRFAEQRVGEPVAADVRLAHHALPGGDVKRFDDFGDVDRRSGGHHVEGELLADDGRQRQQVDAPLGQSHHAALDHLTHAGGHAHGDVGAVERVVDREQPRHLAHEERVAAGLSVHGGRKFFAQLGTGGRGHEGGHTVGVQSSEADDVAAPRHVVEQLRDRMVRAYLGAAVGADHRHRVRRQLGGDEAQQQQRGLVRPVQVVKNDEHWAFGGGPTEKRRYGVEKVEAGLLGFELGRRRRIVESRREFGQQAQDVPAARTEVARQLRVVDVAGVGAQGLDPGPEGGRPFALPTRTPENARPSSVCVCGAVDGEAGFADARLAGEQNDATPAVGRGVDGTAQCRHLCIAPEERGVGRGRARRCRGCLCGLPHDLVQDPGSVEPLEVDGAACAELEPGGAGQLSNEV
jgi:hypothetical protein